MVYRTFGVILVLLCLVSVASAGEDEDQLKSGSKAWIEAFNSGDTKAMAALYASDGMLLPPNAEPVQGQKPIEEFWAGFIEGVKGTLEIQEVIVSGDLAYMLGSYTVLDADGKVVDRGKYVEIWKRGDGKWQLSRDIWNTSIPQPQPAE